MIPNYCQKKQFDVIGFELLTTACDGKNFNEIPLFWDKVLKEDRIKDIPNRTDENTILGLCLDFNEEEGTFRYIIGAQVSSTEHLPEGMVCCSIPSADYVVFTAKGKIPEAIQKTVKYIYEDWFPQSAYNRADSADFELYDHRCTGEADSEVDIYVPVTPKLRS